jgi:hypothetical protein
VILTTRMQGATLMVYRRQIVAAGPLGLNVFVGVRYQCPSEHSWIGLLSKTSIMKHLTST